MVFTTNMVMPQPQFVLMLLGKIEAKRFGEEIVLKDQGVYETTLVMVLTKCEVRKYSIICYIHEIVFKSVCIVSPSRHDLIRLRIITTK